MIQMQHVWKIVDGTVILEDIDFKVEKGEFVFLVGPNGAGKSTILKLVHFDEPPTEGRVVVGDYDSSTIKRRQIPILRRKVGMIFQDFKLLRDRNAFENVAFASKVTGAKRAHIRGKVIQALAMVDMGHRRNAMPDQLSEGEQQRIAIARALINEPFVLLADEPTGNLDAEATQSVMEILRNINYGGTAILMATHDVGLVERTSYRTLRIEEGRLLY